MKIKKFKPITVSAGRYDFSDLSKLTGVQWQYATCGKDAMYHCLSSLGAEGSILIPSYVCKSILEPLDALKLQYVCYDSNLSDLNVDLEDFEFKIQKYKVKFAMVASMYGNPADFKKIQLVCDKYNVLLVDDAAQSFGSTYDEKYVGTFGDAGFFSFSPGKSTSGHLGAFFWTKNIEYRVERKRQCALHMLAFCDFYLNRYKAYSFFGLEFLKILTYVSYVSFRFINTSRGDICKFEKPILEKIIFANFNQKFRKKALNIINKALLNVTQLKILTTGKLGTNNHKLVFYLDNLQDVEVLKSSLRQHNIYVGEGYSNLCSKNECKNTEYITRRIIEIPIEEDLIKAEYIAHTIKDFFVVRR